jgi:hypothetical protein
MYPYKQSKVIKGHPRKNDSKLYSEIANLKQAVAKNNAKFNAQKILNELSRAGPSRV